METVAPEPRVGREREELLRISKERKDEIAKSGVGLSGNDVFVGRQSLGSTGEDRLRSRHELRAIQDLLVGTGQDQGCAGYRSNQECGQCRLGSKRLDAGGFRR